MNAQYIARKTKDACRIDRNSLLCDGELLADCILASDAQKLADKLNEHAALVAVAEQAWREADQRARESARSQPSVLAIVADALNGKNYGPSDACDAVRALEKRAQLMEAVVAAARWVNELNEVGHAPAGSDVAFKKALAALDL